ncbi:MAG: twin-arginine translocation signal domain-containing protein [candidate division Zixibacteria bacterium]|nr:twin-arginine translocation signal domain-containing protein [candidate division Zixibacteria bacterium]
MKEKTSGFSRRKFLATSAAGIVSAGIAGLSPALAVANEIKKPAGEIIYRQLGKTGLKVPVVTHGCGACNDANVIQAAYNMGARMFDTAANYQTGANEMLIGSVLKKMGVRDKSLILTKIYTPAQRRDESPEKIKKKIATLTEGSLKRLRTDYVDILLIHDVRTADVAKNQAIIDAMVEMKKQGKAKFIGISTHANMAEVINSVAEVDAWDVVLSTINFTLANNEEFMAAVDNAGKKDIGFIGMKTLAFGAQWPNPESHSNYTTETVTTALMKWALHNKNVATIMVAFNNMEHMNVDFPVAHNIEYTADEKKLLTDNSIELGMGMCEQCSKCLASCPNDADIPTLMRTNMYATKYVDFTLAQSALEEIDKNRGLDACASCNSCSAKCVNTVDIKSRISELKSIYA